MLVTLFGIVMLFRLPQYENAESPMLVTPGLMTTDLMDFPLACHGAKLE